LSKTLVRKRNTGDDHFANNLLGAGTDRSEKGRHDVGKRVKGKTEKSEFE
jgi:hypothetical protein